MSVHRYEDYTDAEFIEGIQTNNRLVEREFFLSCMDYFNQNHKGVAVVGKGSRDEEDLFQESFLRLWQEIQARRIHIRDNHAWRTDREGTDRRMSASLRTYLMSIVRNRNHEMVREEEIYAPEQPGAADVAEEEPEELEVSHWIVRQCVNDLPPRCRDILTMFYCEGKSLDEILAVRRENQSKDGLKTGKSKCMKSFRNKVLEQFSRFNIKPYVHVQ